MTSFISKADIGVIRWLSRTYVRRQLPLVAAAGACMAVSAFATSALAWLVRPALDSALSNPSSWLLFGIPLLILTVSVFNGVSMYGQTVLMQKAGLRVIAALQVDMFDRFIRADLEYLNRNHKGVLISRCVNDAIAVQNALSGTTFGLFRDLLTFLFLLGVMVMQDWRLSLVTMIAMPGIGLGVGRIGRRARQFAAGMMGASASLVTVLSEAFDGARVIKVYGMEDRERARTKAALDKIAKLTMRMTRNKAASSPLNESLGGLAIALAIIYGTWHIGTGDISHGALASFLAALMMCYRPLKRLAAMNATLQEGLAAGHRVRQVLDLKPTIVDRPDAVDLEITEGSVRFENVEFRYDGGPPVLKGVSFEVPAGKVVAIVGPSGAGKSTLINLIPRLYDVTAGRVLIDGIDVRDVTRASLRRQIAVVSQEVVLFDDTVRANIAFGRPDASDDAVVRAAKAAAAHDFIAKLPQGYETVIGAAGVRLSGGQRQRLAIARALVRDAPILLLDEATSSLDSASEQSFRRALTELMRGRTTIIVAHRLSTIIDAHAIHVVNEGQVVESGRHAELIARRGLYAQLYAMQSIEEQVAANEPDAEPPAVAVG